MADLLGDGLNDRPDAPAMTEAEVLAERERKRQRQLIKDTAGIPLASAASPTAGIYELLDENMGTHADPSSQTHVSRVINEIATPSEIAGAGPTPGDITADTGRRSDEGQTDRANALQSVIDRYDAVKEGFDTSQQDESRQAQREAQQQNRELFSRATAYDPKAAAAQFSEESLSKALAVARSAPGGASRESALFNALEALPAIQAEGQKQANAEGRSQQQVALQASNQLGQLATGTRSQDEGQQEFYTGLGQDAAQAIASFTGHNLDLDSRDREFLGEVALQLAQLDLSRDEMESDEGLKKLELQLAKQGLDQEWRIFKESQKVTGKDILGGIFSLGGGIISGGASILAAGKDKK